VEKEKHICERCGTEGEIHPSEKPNFACSNCGHKIDLLLRRELVDLDSPIEGKIILKIVADSLR
jgi:DNA-directed RNA polymerase subunit RPC12/RpoP